MNCFEISIKKIFLIGFILIFSTNTFARIIGPKVITEDKPARYITDMRPKLGHRQEAIFYNWSFSGPGGAKYLMRPVPTITHTYDTPSEPKKNQVTCILQYLYYIIIIDPATGLPTEKGPLPARHRSSMKILVKDITAPGQDQTTKVYGLKRLSGKTGEIADNNVVVFVKDNNPNYPHPNLKKMKVELYYQIGPADWFEIKNETGAKEFVRFAGPWPDNYYYSEDKGTDALVYTTKPAAFSGLGANPDDIKIFSKTSPYGPEPVSNPGQPDPGWPDTGYFWVGPIKMEEKGRIAHGEKYSTIKFTLNKKKLLMPLHFAQTSKDWQPLKYFIHVVDGSGNTITGDFDKAKQASKNGNIFWNQIDVEDNDPPWIAIVITEKKYNKSAEFGMWPETALAFCNYKEVWDWECNYRWPPPDGKNSFTTIDWLTIDEDTRVIFHPVACDNIDRIPTVMDTENLHQFPGIDKESCLFKIYDESDKVIAKVEKDNDFLFSYIFKNPGKYVIEFSAKDLNSNARTMKVLMIVGDTKLYKETIYTIQHMIPSPKNK